MKGGRVRRSCFASLHVSPASFPPSSFLRTQRRARSRRRRRPVKPPVSPHRTPRAPKAHPPPRFQRGVQQRGHRDVAAFPPRAAETGAMAAGGTGRSGEDGGSRLGAWGRPSPWSPPRTFPVAARKLSRPEKLRGGRGALTCCGRGSQRRGDPALGSDARGAGGRAASGVRPPRAVPEVQGVSWCLRAASGRGPGWGPPCSQRQSAPGGDIQRGVGWLCALVPHQAGPSSPSAPDTPGCPAVGPLGAPGGSVRAGRPWRSVPKQGIGGSCVKALRSSGHNRV